jgi:Flp pilus assembly protein TadD
MAKSCMAMSSRDKRIARWLWPGISLVLACAGLTLLTLKRYWVNPRASAGAAVEKQHQTISLATGTNPPLLNLAPTNRSESEVGEDRVVTLVTEGNQLLERGKFAEAAEKYDQAVQLAPGDEDLHYNLAIALAKLGKTDQARKQYGEALEIYPDYADARNNLGNLLMNENKLGEAIDQFRAAVTIAPENASFHNNLGTAFGRQRKVTEAMEEFRQAVKLKPAYVEARVNLANAYLTAGQVEEAVSQLNEALRLQPGFQPGIQSMQRARQKQASNSVPK